MQLSLIVMQAVMGTLVKRFLAKKLGLKPEHIYHCAVMPCYDKKLEGSREDFMIPGEHPLLASALVPCSVMVYHQVTLCLYSSGHRPSSAYAFSVKQTYTFSP